MRYLPAIRIVFASVLFVHASTGISSAQGYSAWRLQTFGTQSIVPRLAFGGRGVEALSRSRYFDRLFSTAFRALAQQARRRRDPGTAERIYAKSLYGVFVSLGFWCVMNMIQTPLIGHVPRAIFFPAMAVAYILVARSYEPLRRGSFESSLSLDPLFMQRIALLSVGISAMTLGDPLHLKKLLSLGGAFDHHAVWTTILVSVAPWILSRAFYAAHRSYFWKEHPSHEDQRIFEWFVGTAMVLMAVGLSANYAVFELHDVRFYRLECAIRNPLAGASSAVLAVLWAGPRNLAALVRQPPPRPDFVGKSA